MNKKILLFFVIVFCCLSAKVISAESSYYVDSSYLYKGTGSQEQPFNTISQAIDTGVKNIYVANGTYEGDIELKDVNLIGEDRDGVIIKDRVIIYGESSLENVSVILEQKENEIWYDNQWQRSSVGILADKDSDVLIKNVFVSGCGIGIDSSGGGRITIENSIVTKNAKAVYIGKNREVDISNSEIFDNDEEGIDLRENVKGSIKNNIIRGNSLSGIEAVVGYSDVSIYDNEISNNGNSGITLQYYNYESSDHIGNFKMNNNQIFDNNKNAITCNRPSGGSPGGKYWSDSIDEMKDNSMYGNKMINFDSACKFSNEMKFNAMKEIENLDSQIEKGHFKFFKDEVDRQIVQTAVQNRSKLKTFFIGSDYDKLDKLNQKIESYESHINKLNELSQKIENEKLIELIEKDKKEIEELNKSVREFIKKERNKFSVFGWMID